MALESELDIDCSQNSRSVTRVHQQDFVDSVSCQNNCKKLLYALKVYKLICTQEHLKYLPCMYQKVNKKCVRIRSFYHVNVLMNPLGTLPDNFSFTSLIPNFLLQVD